MKIDFKKINWPLLALAVINVLVVFSFSIAGNNRLNIELKQAVIYFGIFFLLLLLVYKKDRQPIRIAKTPFDLLLAFLLIAMSFSALWGVETKTSFLGLGEGLSLPVMLFFALAVFYFIVNIYGFNKRYLARLVGVNLAIFGFLVVFSILLLFGFVWPQELFSKLFSTAVGSLEELALLLAVFNVLFFALFINKNNILNRLIMPRARPFILFAFIASLILLILINYSAAWLVLIVGFIFVLALYFIGNDLLINKKYYWLIAFIAIPLILLFAGSLNSASLSRSRLQENFILDHKRSASIAWQSFKESPIIGHGNSVFADLYSKYFNKDWNLRDDWHIRYESPSSEFFNFIISYGLLGTGLFLALIAVFLKFIFRIHGAIFAMRSVDVRKSVLYSVFVASAGVITSIFTIFFTARMNVPAWFMLFLFLSVLSLSSRAFKNPEGGQLLKQSHYFGAGTSDYQQKIMAIFLFGINVALFAMFLLSVKYGIANCYYNNSHKNEANINKAYQMNPDNLRIELSLAKEKKNQAIALLESGIKDEQESNKVKGLFNESLHLSKQAQAKHPQSPLPIKMIAASYKEISDYSYESPQDAISYYIRAKELEPMNPMLDIEIGNLYYSLNNFSEAYKYYQLAQNLKPGLFEAEFMTAKVLIAQNKYEEARVLLENMDALGNEMNVFYELGRVYYNLGIKDKAQEEFLEVVQIEPNHSNAIYSLGLMAEEAQEYQLALDYYRKVQKNNPDNTELKERIKRLESFEGE